MAKKTRKKAVSRKSYTKSDNNLMLLAAAAATIIMAIFAIFVYKGKNFVLVQQTPLTNLTVNLDPQNNSGQKGTLTLTESDGKVTAILKIDDETKGATEPAHIHVGSCPNPGAVKFPLNSVVNGTSTTVLATTLSALKGMGALAVNVHKSASQISSYVSCGDVRF